MSVGTWGDRADPPADACPPGEPAPGRPDIACEPPVASEPQTVSDADILVASRRMLEEARHLLAEARRTIETGSGGSTTTSRQDPCSTGGRPAHRTTRRAAKLITTLPAAAGIVMLGTALGELHGSPLHQGAVVAGAQVEAAAPPSHPAPGPSLRLSPALPAQPTWLAVPRLGVTAPVTTAVGVQSSGADKGLLSAPSDYHDLGWYRQDGRGLLVIDGHVGYRQDPGPLAFIGQLSSGDLITVGTQNGAQSFRVKEVGHALKGELPPGYFTPAYSGDLMLITCDYTSPFAAGHFAANVYVVAVPAD